MEPLSSRNSPEGRCRSGSNRAATAFAVTAHNDGKRSDTDDGAILTTLAGDNPDTAGDYTF